MPHLIKEIYPEGSIRAHFNNNSDSASWQLWLSGKAWIESGLLESIPGLQGSRESDLPLNKGASIPKARLSVFLKRDRSVFVFLVHRFFRGGQFK